MKIKTSKIVIAVTIGTAGVLALGACSSGANQATESNSPSPTGSTLSDSDRAAAGANHKGFVTVPAPKGSYSKVVVTHNPAAKCTRTEKSDTLVIDCTNVTQNAFGDAVYVRVPGKNFQIAVRNLSYSQGASMITTQRDHAASAYAHKSSGEWQDWFAPNLWTAGSGWGVGVESSSGNQPIHVRITVDKD